MAFYCKDCEHEHEGLPDLGADAPDGYLGLTDDERKRAELTPDRCTITHENGETDYFIRGVVEIPVHGQEESWGIGVWVSQSEKNFERYLEDDGDGMEPTFGWLATRLGFYEEDTLSLKTRAHFRGDGMRPSIELEPTDHPLAVHQREGISLAEAWKIIHRYMD